VQALKPSAWENKKSKQNKIKNTITADVPMVAGD
jgi:hypothetical protein